MLCKKLNKRWILFVFFQWLFCKLLAFFIRMINCSSCVISSHHEPDQALDYLSNLKTSIPRFWMIASYFKTNIHWRLKSSVCSKKPYWRGFHWILFRYVYLSVINTSFEPSIVQSKDDKMPLIHIFTVWFNNSIRKDFRLFQ